MIDAAEAFQTKGFGSALRSARWRLMATCRSTIEWKLPRRMRFRVSAEKKFSAAFNHDPEVGVKWKLQRGCRWSHAFTFVIDHRLDQLAGRNGALDVIEEAGELVVPDALHRGQRDTDGTRHRPAGPQGPRARQRSASQASPASPASPE